MTSVRGVGPWPLRWACWVVALWVCAGAAAGQEPAGEELVTTSLAEQWFGAFFPYTQQATAVLVSIAKLYVVALPLQWLIPAARRKPKVRTYEFWLDVVFWMQGIWLGALGFFALLTAAQRWIFTDMTPWFPALGTLPWLLQVVAAIYLFDLAVYWRHRLEHRWTPLWAFHAVHHSTESVDLLTTSRLHPFELLTGGILNVAVAKAGFSGDAVATAFSIYLHYNYFIHLNARIRWPGWLRYILVSPFMHQWHHSPEPEASGKNLGVVFAFHDWVFGTYHHPADYPVRFGLGVPAAEAVPQSYVRLLVYPLQLAWVRLRAALGRTAGAG